MLTHPQILILDNPFIGLDAASRILLTEMLAQMSEMKELQVILLLSNPDDIPEMITHILPVRNRICHDPMSRNDFLQNKDLRNYLFPEVHNQIRLPDPTRKKSEHNVTFRMEKINISYGSHPILKGLDWEVKNGEKWVLLGENGAGKSTLLRLLLGELPIGENPKGDQEEGSSDGSIEILGQDIRQFKDWSSISYVPQNGMGGWKDFPASVEEIVRANLYKQIGLFRFAGKKERQQVRAALAQVGMEEYQNRLIGRLSGGQQQRVLLARALVNEPKLLILDEPTSALDEKNASHFYRLLKKINAEKRITVLMVTHDLKRASSYADDVWVLEDGRVKQEAGKGDGQA